jgi:hypothetical protein
MIADVMQGRKYVSRLACRLAIVAAIVSIPATFAAAQATQEGAEVKAKPPTTVTVRGCLNGSTITRIETTDHRPTVPDKLQVKVDRVIRGQLKSLNGHQVELNGTIRHIPGEETGILVADSDKGKVYLGGGDANLGNDLVVKGNQPPTIYARMIKDVAASCPGDSQK